MENTEFQQTPIIPETPIISEPSLKPAETLPKPKNNRILIIIIAILLLAVLYLLYLNFNKPSTITSTSTPTTGVIPTETAIPTTDPTADWKTYTNIFYSFKYPSNWNLVDLTKGNQIEVYYQPDKTKSVGEILIEDMGQSMRGLDVYTKTKLIGGLTAKCSTGTEFVTSCYFVSDKKEYISFTIIKDQSAIYNQTLNQILSTFKFTNSANSGKGTVMGSLCYPSESIPPGSVVAKNISTRETFTQKYPGTAVDPLGKFSFQLNPGTYHFKFEIGSGGFAGYYDKCAKTMELADCTPDENHQHFNVTVNSNQNITGISICDFYYSQKQGIKLESTF